MRIGEMVATASGEIPNYYEPGWAWWAYVLAVAGLVVAAFVMALGYALVTDTGERLEGSRRQVPGVIAASIVVMVAIIGGYMLPGALMRHTPTAAGVLGIVGATLLLGLVAWWWASVFMADRFNRNAAALPAGVLTCSAVIYGISEALTRAAASIPVPVGTLGALVLVGALVMFLYAKTAR